VRVLNRSAKVQDVLAPLPPPPDQTPTALEAYQSNEMNVFASPTPQTESQPFQWEALPQCAIELCFS
jgi:hypothetical protein